MFDRLAPFGVLLLNQLLLAMAYLFLLLWADTSLAFCYERFLVASAIWTVPDLVQVGWAMGTDARLAPVFSAVKASIRAGHIAFVLALAAGALVVAIADGRGWEYAALAALVVCRFVEASKLRRYLDQVEAMDS